MKNTTNAIAAWCDEKILAPYLIDSTVNSDVFYAWTKDRLIPELPDKSVIVMDNATFHKRTDIVEILQEAGMIFFGCHLIARILTQQLLL